nr:unnamed protein product [Callosobruchus chinensis]
MINMCSVNCLSLYSDSIDDDAGSKVMCTYCQNFNDPVYYLSMSDGTVRSFCGYHCVSSFQNKFPKIFTIPSSNETSFPVPTGVPRRNKDFPIAAEGAPAMADSGTVPVISSVQSLSCTNGSSIATQVIPALGTINSRSTRSKTTATPPAQIPQITTANAYADVPVHVQIKHHFIVRPAPLPEQRNVGTMCYTKKASKGVMMKPDLVDKGIQTDEREAAKILIPVPVPVYVPAPMHLYSAPTPVPKIQVKIPTDPYEAELLMMAEMVAEEKKEDVTDSESDIDDGGPEDSYSPEPVEASNTFGDDMLQMALKMATELEEPAVDLEGALTANTITAPQEGHGPDDGVDEHHPMHQHMMDRNAAARGRKRVHIRRERLEAMGDDEKYRIGKILRRCKLFKTEILQLTSDELSYSLCLFVKEVRKPNGAEYAPDTIYYLCLGIQQYLFEMAG